MKVAILGGTRSIGPAIVRELLRQNHEVAVVHRGQTKCVLPGGVTEIFADRDLSGQVVDAFRAFRPAGVIDMCGYHPGHLEEIVRADLDLSRYVFCSSTAVYGRIFKTTPDELSPVKPKSDYEIGKVACENLLLLAQKELGLPVTILRLSHPYGPSEELIYSTGRDSLFLDRMRRGKPIIIPSTGDTRMHPIFIDDVARGFVHALTSDPCAGRCFNLASDEILTHDEYFASVARVLNVPLIAEHIPGEWFEVHASQWKDLPRNFNFAAVWHRYEGGFDVSMLRETGFRFQTNHDDGVRANIDWLDQQGMIPHSADDDLEEHVLRAWRRSP
jgi:nucleoside-diphosphate-sugar epimerase